MKTFVKGFALAVALAAGTYSYAAVPGDGSSNPSLKQLIHQTKALESLAERPAEHRTLAAEYRQIAQLQREEAAKMDDRAAWYSRFPIYSSEKFKRSTIDSSLFFARKYRADAQKSDDLATRHERLAG